MAGLTNVTKQNKAMTLLSVVRITGISLETHAVTLEFSLFLKKYKGIYSLIYKISCVAIKRYNAITKPMHFVKIELTEIVSPRL